MILTSETIYAYVRLSTNLLIKPEWTHDNLIMFEMCQTLEAAEPPNCISDF